MTWGISDAGFRLKPQNDIVQDIQNRITNDYKSAYPNNEPIYLGSDNILGQTIEAVGAEIFRLWEHLQNSYNSQFVITAEGSNIQRASKGIPKIEAISATTTLQFTISSSASNVEIPQSTIVMRDDSTAYTTSERVVSPTYQGGTVSVTASAVVAGASGNTNIGTITSLQIPISGVSGVTNTAPAIFGVDEETDIAFKQRLLGLQDRGRSSSLLDISNAVKRVANVSYVKVEENASNTVDEHDRPPNSIEVIVRGGDDQEVAYAIIDQKAGGVGMFGSEEVPLLIESGFSKVVRFNRAVNVGIEIKVAISIKSGFTLDTAVMEQITNSIRLNYIRYVGGNFNDTFYDGLEVAQGLQSWALENIVFDYDSNDTLRLNQNLITNIVVTGKKSTDASYSPNAIEVSRLEKLIINSTDDIEVTYA